MKMTEEIWESFGFKKIYAWEKWGWIYKEDSQIKFFEGVSVVGIGDKEPKTVEELLSALQKYWKRKYKEEGKNEVQSNMRQLLGLEI